MLTRLSIKNYALIDELTIDFPGGFNIVTGETGAGKSIILGALSLILGARADTSALRDSSKKCIVEGVIQISKYNLASFFETNDLDYEEISILRREITSSGKSRAFINDTPVNLKIISELGRKLIDIHSQHQNLELSNHKFQLEMVDVVAGNEKILREYQELYSEFLSKKSQLNKLKELEEKERSDLDYYEYQFRQLEEAKLTDGEQEGLEEEQEVLVHAEEIIAAFAKVDELLNGERLSALRSINEGNAQLLKISGYFSEASELQKRLESVYIELKDISEEITSLSASVEYNPQRLEQVTQRLDQIYSLQQKHQVNSVKELLEVMSEVEKHIAGIVDYGLKITQLDKETRELEKRLQAIAGDIRNKRKEVFPLIEKKVIGMLKQLGMPGARFKVAHQGLDGLTGAGIDSVGFLFSANKDIEPAEISKIASGGETSRLMLAVKSLVTDSKTLPTIIFDEIDSGVSGEIALKMGDILKEFSKTSQIINITHLPQIAGKGDHHFKVYKFEHKNSTFTSIKKLDQGERIEELAKMVGGDKPTENALQTAKDLLN